MNEILEIIKECTSNPWFHIRKFQKSIKLPIYYSKILTYIVWESESKNPYTVGARYLESQYMELLNKWNKFFYRKKSLLTQYITSRRSYMEFLICESVNFSYYKDSKKQYQFTIQWNLDNPDKSAFGKPKILCI